MPINNSASALSPLRTFAGVTTAAVGLILGVATLSAAPPSDYSGISIEIATGLEELMSSPESVTLSIGWPGLMESKIGSIALPPGVLTPAHEEAAWSSDSLQIGIIPEPRFLALILAIAVGAVFLTVRRRHWA